MDKKLKQKLDIRLEEGTLRSLSSYKGMIDFISNDYLGLANALTDSKESKGSTGSRLISGNDERTEKLEDSVAAHFGYDSGLFFNSGYDANLGVFSSIPQRDDIVLYDEHIHASVRDGIRLGLAKSFSFKHNDTEDLKRLVERFSGKAIYVAVEGLYSMHGDVAPLSEIVELCTGENVRIIIDEAHSAGVLGEGLGLTTQLGLDKSIYLKLVTYGKAFGGHGACVLTDNETHRYLVNFARSFIYTTALPLTEYRRMSDVLRVEDLPNRREKLRDNISYFRSKVSELKLISDPSSPIQIIQLELGRLRRIEEGLLKKGIAGKVIQPPTVKAGEECIRCCLHSFNTKEEIDKLTSILLVK